MLSSAMIFSAQPSVYFSPPRYWMPSIPGPEADDEWPADDLRHLRAAKAFLASSDDSAAREEWCQISLHRRWLPRARLVELRLVYRSLQWQAALDIAQTLIPLLPYNAEPRTVASYCLEQLGRLPEAIELLLALHREGCICYPVHNNLAGYACRLGHMEEARQWLRRSLRYEPGLTRLYAYSDDDLQPILDELDLPPGNCPLGCRPPSSLTPLSANPCPFVQSASTPPPLQAF